MHVHPQINKRWHMRQIVYVIIFLYRLMLGRQQTVYTLIQFVVYIFIELYRLTSWNVHLHSCILRWGHALHPIYILYNKEKSMILVEKEMLSEY